ncbi:hypothetical protein COT72_01215 [archaeon CG10_big_fil_rev_8_21_14_0_10_43_11]|nr:MAG: hypothetical protein COT72_01215 [archaeon CG10_big_fil_rev_8_21_14_0_10_43_11]
MKHVHHYDVSGNFVHDWQNSGFSAGRVSQAGKLVERMLQDKDCTIFMSVAGALIPSGMRNVLGSFLKNAWVDALVVTGATLTHDLAEALGYKHFMGTHNADDAKLHEKRLDRVWDVYFDDHSYEGIEDFCKKVFKNLEKKSYSSKEIIWKLGEHITDENSLIRQSYLKQIPIYCPALVDCGLGMQVWTYAKEYGFSVDPFKDWDELVAHHVWTAKKTGVILLGGGVPKNFILQAQQFNDATHGYALQITTADVNDGGLSGAELREGISWGKLSKDSEVVDVRADITLVLPIIVDYLKKQGVTRIS